MRKVFLFIVGAAGLVGLGAGLTTMYIKKVVQLNETVMTPLDGSYVTTDKLSCKAAPLGASRIYRATLYLYSDGPSVKLMPDGPSADMKCNFVTVQTCPFCGDATVYDLRYGDAPATEISRPIATNGYSDGMIKVECSVPAITVANEKWRLLVAQLVEPGQPSIGNVWVLPASTIECLNF